MWTLPKEDDCPAQTFNGCASITCSTFLDPSKSYCVVEESCRGKLSDFGVQLYECDGTEEIVGNSQLLSIFIKNDEYLLF